VTAPKKSQPRRGGAHLFDGVETRAVGRRCEGVLNGLEIGHKEQELSEERLNHDQTNRTDLGSDLKKGKTY
jgi:hypothetical protein